MVDLSVAKISDLLPPNLKADDTVAAAAAALDGELSAVTTAIEECLLLPRLDVLAEDVIDLLAWQWHVEGYQESLTIEHKRKLVLQSIAWHRRKGTPGLVQDLVSAIYSSGVVTEWFEYGGEPFHFRVQTTGIIGTEGIYEQLKAAIAAAKNVRSWLDGVYVIRTWRENRYMGVFVRKGKHLTLSPAAFASQAWQHGQYFRGALHVGKKVTIGVGG